MAITLKSPADIEKLRISGRMVAEVLAMIADHVRPGVTTNELDAICNRFIVNELKAVPANVGYMGFPKTICASVNHVVCHGIPGPKELKDGDIINIAIIKDSYFGDTSRMYHGGTPNKEAQRLVATTYKAMVAGIREVKLGARLATSARRSRRSRIAKAFPSCASTADTASGVFITKIRRCCITANAARACASSTALSSSSNR